MSPNDWRSLPRTLPHKRKSVIITARLTEQEAKKIKAKAKAIGLTMTDFIVRRCLGKRS